MAGLSGSMEIVDFSGTPGYAVCSPPSPDLANYHVFLKYPEWMKSFLHPHGRVSFMDVGVEFAEGMCILDATSEKSSLVPQPRSHHRVAEGFAGLGGWSVGSGFAGAEPILAVEMDEMTAKAFAKSHEVPLFDVVRAFQILKEQATLPRCIILGNILDPRIWVISGCLNVGTWLLSPPCPPWCSAGRSNGLDCSDGLLLIQTLEMAAKCGIRFALVENVQHIVKHRDFASIKEAATRAGLPLVLSRVDDCAAVVPCQRKRWFGLFVNQIVPVPWEQIQMAANMQWPGTLTSQAEAPYTLAVADAIHVNISQVEEQELLVSPQMLEMMKDSPMDEADSN